MKTIIFNKELNVDNVALLCDQIDTHWNDSITLCVSSDKGDYEAEELLVYYLDFITTAPNIEIHLIAFGKLYEHMFNVFFRCKVVKKSIIFGTEGAIIIDKLPAIDKRRGDYGTFSALNQEKRNEEYLKWLEPVYLTKKSIAMLKKGEPVYFNYKQLADILNASGKILMNGND